MRARSPFLLSLLAVLVLACHSKQEELPKLFPVPDTKLVDETGKTVSLRAMKFHVTVYDLIFSSCTGTCPIMTTNMRALTPRVAKDAAVLFVTMTVDPVRDTPAVLANYAKRVLNDHRWIFL